MFALMHTCRCTDCDEIVMQYWWAWALLFATTLLSLWVELSFQIPTRTRTQIPHRVLLCSFTNKIPEVVLHSRTNISLQTPNP